MHIPNGFLSDPVCAATTLTSAAALGLGVARMRQSHDMRSSAMVAATGAGLFAAQMVNFPIGEGTSGHMLGAALAAILLGPWRGMLTMAVVLIVQCLAFGDGGLSALGANVLNMAVVGCLSASAIHGFVSGRLTGARGKLVGVAAAAFGSVLASAAMCSVELAASGTFGFASVLWAMLSVHAVIGLAEAALSVAVVAAVAAVAREGASVTKRRALAGALCAAVAVAGLLAPWASSAPDGLERVAEDLEFAGLAGDASWSLVSDYAAPGITWPALAVALAGIAGVAFVFVSAYTADRAARVRVRKQ